MLSSSVCGMMRCTVTVEYLRARARERERNGWMDREGRQGGNRRGRGDGYVCVKVKESESERKRKMSHDSNANAYSYSKVIAQTVNLYIVQDLYIHAVKLLIAQDFH